MISTFEALLVALLALLPGAGYTWAFEQQVGRWGANFSDRLWRFVGVSAVFAVGSLYALYWGYQEFIVTGALAKGQDLPGWIWFVVPLYFVVPWGVGSFVGYHVGKRHRWAEKLVGTGSAPRAWDYLFTTHDLNGWIRLTLMDGSSIVGFWGAEDTEGGVTLRSYASGYPEVQELYFSDTAAVDVEGNVEVDEDERPLATGVGVLIRWDQVRYAYFSEG